MAPAAAAAVPAPAAVHPLPAMSGHIWHPRRPRDSPPADLRPSEPHRLWPTSHLDPPHQDPDADAVFRNLLNLHIDDSPPTPHAPALAQSFRPQHHHLLHHNHPHGHQQHLRLSPSPLHSDQLTSPTSAAAAAAASRHYLPHDSSIPPSLLMHTITGHPAPYQQPTPLSVDGALPDPRLLRLPQSAPTPLVSAPLSVITLPQSAQPAPRIKNELYKTEICRSFAESGGFCKYGSKCQFAHGDVELRPVRRHPRYKTKLCRNFVTTGSCPYDARCRFIHANDLPYAQQATIPSSASIPLDSSASSPVLGFPGQAVQQQQHNTSQSQVLLAAEAFDASNAEDSYTDNMQRFFALSDHAQISADRRMDSLVDSINADQRSVTPSLDLQTDKPHLQSVLPTDHVFHANANVFQNYPDNNAFHHTFMHLSGAESDLRTSSADFLERDPVHTSLLHGPASVAAAVCSEPDISITDHFSTGSEPQTGSLFSQPSSSKSPASQAASTQNGAVRSSQSSEVVKDVGSRAPPASSPISRPRLPVFRNMASDADEL